MAPQLTPEQRVLYPFYQHIGLIIWYVVFIVIIPITISQIYSPAHLKYYLPVIDLFANTFASSGSEYDHLFANVYQNTPTNLISFFSTNLISWIALMGVAWNILEKAYTGRPYWLTAQMAGIMFLVTYLFPTQIIPRFSEWFQMFIDHRVVGYPLTPKPLVHWKRYIGGIVLTIILVLIENWILQSFVYGR